MAVASLVLGIISIVISLIFSFFSVFIGLPIGIVAIVLGVVAKKNAIENQDDSNLGTAKAGFITGIIGSSLSLIMWLTCVACIGAASTGISKEIKKNGGLGTLFEEMGEELRYGIEEGLNELKNRNQDLDNLELNKPSNPKSKKQKKLNKYQIKKQLEKNSEKL